MRMMKKCHAIYKSQRNAKIVLSRAHIGFHLSMSNWYICHLLGLHVQRINTHTHWHVNTRTSDTETPNDVHTVFSRTFFFFLYCFAKGNPCARPQNVANKRMCVLSVPGTFWLNCILSLLYISLLTSELTHNFLCLAWVKEFCGFSVKNQLIQFQWEFFEIFFSFWVRVVTKFNFGAAISLCQPNDEVVAVCCLLVFFRNFKKVKS